MLGPLFLAVITPLINILLLLLSLIFNCFELPLYRSSRLAAQDANEGGIVTTLGHVLHKLHKPLGALFGVIIVLLLAANFLYFEPTMRWVAESMHKRTGTKIEFSAVGGNIFTGHFSFHNLSVKKANNAESSFDIIADKVEIDLDMLSLVFRPIKINKLNISGIIGEIDHKRPSHKTHTTGKPKVARHFIIQDLELNNIKLSVSQDSNAIVKFLFQKIQSKLFRSEYAIFDTFFNSNVEGTIDGSSIEISTQHLASGYESMWNIVDLPADTIRKFIKKAPFNWLNGGAVSVKATSKWQNSDVHMDWRVITQKVHLAPPDDINPVKNLLTLTIAQYIDSKGGDVDLHFALVLDQHKFKNTASLDAAELWTAIISSVAKTLAENNPQKAMQLKQDFDSKVEGFKSFLNKNHK